MTREAGSGPRWLDSLARWSARGEVAARTPPPSPPPGNDEGISRRTALWTAGAAALSTGPLSLLIPATAAADQAALSKCIANAEKGAFDDFQACVKNPLEAFGLYRQAIQTAEDKLRTSKDRKRLLGVIDRSTKGLERTVAKLEGCNAAWLADRNTADADCYKANPPPAGGSGGTSGGTGSFCDPTQEIQCGNICCNATGHPECCFCGKTGMYSCCASGSNCTCCGAP